MQSTKDLTTEDLNQSILLRAKDTRLERLQTLVETLHNIESNQLWSELDASILERLAALVDKEDELLVHKTLYVQAALDSLLLKYRTKRSRYQALRDQLLAIAENDLNAQKLLSRLEDTDRHFIEQMLLRNLD